MEAEKEEEIRRDREDRGKKEGGGYGDFLKERERVRVKKGVDWGEWEKKDQEPPSTVVRVCVEGRWGMI